MDRAKVIPLEPETQRQNRARLARLPASVHAVHDKGKTLVLNLLQGFFERADDSLFELADKALSNQEQNIYFDSMREVRVQRRNIEKRFADAIDDAFAVLASPQQQPVEREDTITADVLSLVQNDELEEMVALDSSIARANNAYAEPIQQISLRLDSLVPVKVYQKNNPLGPDVICSAFMDQAKRLDIDIKAKLVLFKLFDKTVVNQLGDVYRTINEVLVDHNVLPSLQAAVQKRPAPPSANPVASSSESDQARYYMQGAGQTNPELIAILRQVLGEQAVAEPTAEFQEQFSHSQLLNLLSLAQRMPAVQERAATASVDVRRLLDALQKQRGVEADIGGVDEKVMHLVNMLFEFVVEDRNLATPMKALISRLQIPILKVALVDKTFFTKGGHAARRLLNEMSTAALGWQGDIDDGRKDPLFSKMQEIVNRLLNDFDADVGLFSELLVDFTSFLEKEKRRAAVLERRTLDAEDGRARAEHARATVAREVQARAQGKSLPEVVTKLIDEAWSNVLFVSGLKYGYDSQEWQQGLATLEQLVWSVQPPRNTEHRQRLIKLVPVLLKQLRAGLDTISYNPFEMSELFKSLQAAHLACIRGESSKAAPVTVTVDDSAVERVADPSAVEAAAQATASEVTVEPEPTTEPELTDNDPHMRQVEGFSQGSWFEMGGDGDRINRCRLAAFIKPTGKYIFVNRNGMKVAEKTQSELAWLLKRGELRPLDNSMLFDRALEQVVSSLRR